MEIVYMPDALKDINYWTKSGNKRIQKKITELLDAILINPFEGIGKPEQLKHELSGFWSRRIDKEVLEDEQQILIHSARGHY